MESNGFDENEREKETGEQPASWVPSGEQPTTPGLDPTQNYEPVQPAGSAGPQSGSPEGGPEESQPKWQPLPGGQWAPPVAGGEWAPPAPPQGYGGPAQPGGYGYGQPGPYGPPGYGGPPPGYGSPAGWAEHGPGGPLPTDKGSGWSTARKLVAVALIAIVMAAAGSAGALLATRNTSKPGNASGGSPIPNPQSAKQANNTKLDVSKIASEVDPATVDITSVLSSQSAEAEGTGMILTKNGEVLTNNHVIEGGTRITAQVDGTGRRYSVKVLGTDVKADVALVQLLGASNLPTVKVGNSSQIRVGDQVVAIGNALGLGGTPTVTSGIISARNRSINASDAGSALSEHLTGLLQTDAPINPGNSGGPLVDSAGQVIGMDTAAANGSPTQSASNIGFAIPIDKAISIAQAIEQGRGSSQILIGPKGILGVDVLSVQQAQQESGGFFGPGINPPVNYGAYVLRVIGGSPAASAGISTGDVITAVNGKKIPSPVALSNALSNDKPGTTVSVTWVTSSGNSETHKITLEADPQAA